MRKQLAAVSATLLGLVIGQVVSVSGFTRSSVQKEPFLQNQVCTTNDQLKYEGYEVWRKYDDKTKISRVTIQKGARVLAIHSDGQGIEMKEASCFGLYPVLGGKTKQLVVVQTTGGAHCCFLYRIYDLRPKFRLIFDSAKYPIGDGFDELEFKDIDGDGIHEFTQRDMTFHYWEGLSYVSSPEPEVVFQYNRRARRFHLASKRFSAYLLKDIEKQIKDQDANDPDLDWATVDITLRYIFAGKQELGWKFYDKQFGIKPGEPDKMKTKIKNALRRDVLYRLTYER